MNDLFSVIAFFLVFRESFIMELCHAAFPDYLEYHFAIEKSDESSIFKLSLFVSCSRSLFLHELAF